MTRFHLNTGDDLLEAETIMQDVVQRRRRVFGPAHPETRAAERELSSTREALTNHLLDLRAAFEGEDSS